MNTQDQNQHTASPEIWPPVSMTPEQIHHFRQSHGIQLDRQIKAACNEYESNQAELSRLRAEREELLGALKDAEESTGELLSIVEGGDSGFQEQAVSRLVILQNDFRSAIQRAQEGSK